MTEDNMEQMIRDNVQARYKNGNGHHPAEMVAELEERPDGTVNHPPHYISANGLEVIDVIEGFSLGFHEGNVLKYLLRWRQKGGIEDLLKARWYLDRFIKGQQ